VSARAANVRFALETDVGRCRRKARRGGTSSGVIMESDRREGQQEVGTREHASTRPIQSALGLLPVTPGAGSVTTGVVAVLALPAVITRGHVPTEGRRATGPDVAQGAPKAN
jgi:hypothetical protein